MTSPQSHRFVPDLDEIDPTDLAGFGGKAANLAELMRIDDVHVPGGFCVTTDAFGHTINASPSMADLLRRLAVVSPADRPAISSIGAEIRHGIAHVNIADEIKSAIAAAVHRLGDGVAFAVRSSATAEDLAAASFAGQHDSYLNIIGADAVLDHIRRCWASLFTDRAVIYRARHGIDHRDVRMAVIVQQMADARAAGVLFTADPVTSNRKISVVEATFGLGEALVSGAVNADVYTVRDVGSVETSVSTKLVATEPSADGGTRTVAIDPDRQQVPVLTEKQAIALVSLGRRIESHFATPQDIEWCLVDDEFRIVQSRAITTLFPIPPSPMAPTTSGFRSATSR